MQYPESALAGEFATIQQLMKASAEAFGDRDAYVDGDQRISYADWMQRAGSLAAEFRSRGIGRGDVVALMLPSGIDYAVAYAAAAKLGAIATGLNTRLGRREIGSILAQCAPALVVAGEAADLPDPPAGTAVLDRAELARVCERPPSGEPGAEAAPDDIVTIMWTSGTTGQPKGVCLDHRNMSAISDAAGVLSAPGDRRLVTTPFAHAGYMAKLWDQLANGVTIVVCPPTLPPAEMLRLVVEQQTTVVGAVPTQWERMLRLPGLDDADLSGVRIGTSATAPIRPELVAEINERMGFPLVVRYAMTESPTICGTEPDDPPEVQFRTVGRPQKGMEISVTAPDGPAPDGPVADDPVVGSPVVGSPVVGSPVAGSPVVGSPVAGGPVGQVRVRGGCVMRGYWNAPELTRQAFDDEGWLVSGDLGYLREDGNLVIVGRATDMYIRGGYNVYPAEVEAVLALHPAVRSVSVVGTPAARIGEIGVAFVVPADAGKPPGLDELRELVRSELADYKAPDRLEIIEQLPANSLLKTDKNALRALAAGSRT
jgi:acyl-CoA synthetase (AMP-forming)/AMP-acid ligase II